MAWTSASPGGSMPQMERARYPANVKPTRSIDQSAKSRPRKRPSSVIRALMPPPEILNGRATGAAARAEPPLTAGGPMDRSGDATSGRMRQGRSRHGAHGGFAAIGQPRSCPRDLPLDLAVRCGSDPRQPIALEGPVYRDGCVLVRRRCRNCRHLQAGHQGQEGKGQADAEKIGAVFTHEIAPPVRRGHGPNGSKPGGLFLVGSGGAAGGRGGRGSGASLGRTSGRPQTK
jgi:hypothetical protein